MIIFTILIDAKTSSLPVSDYLSAAFAYILAAGEVLVNLDGVDNCFTNTDICLSMPLIASSNCEGQKKKKKIPCTKVSSLELLIHQQKSHCRTHVKCFYKVTWKYSFYKLISGYDKRLSLKYTSSWQHITNPVQEWIERHDKMPKATSQIPFQLGIHGMQRNHGLSGAAPPKPHKTKMKHCQARSARYHGTTSEVPFSWPAASKLMA